MSCVENPPLTAGDLMSRDVETIAADLPLPDAAMQLARRGVHGAPVVDAAGRCVGVLSVSDLARRVAGRGGSGARLPKTCGFQEEYREPGGRETALCLLAEGICPFQRLREMADGRLALACAEPRCVPVDWQMVERESLPGATVRDVMTTAVLTADPTTPVTELARVMLEHEVHRLIVLDPDHRPVGMVAVDDLLQILAHPEVVAPGGLR